MVNKVLCITINSKLYTSTTVKVTHTLMFSM